MKTNIVWIINDLRFEDNTALIKAVDESYEENAALILVFHINDDQVKIGTYSNDYFFSALNVFYRRLKNMGVDLLFLVGNPETAFNSLFEQIKTIHKVYFNISERGYGFQRDKKVIKIIKEHHGEVSCYFDKHLHSADKILTGSGTNYKVFTSYYKKWSTVNKSPILSFDMEYIKNQTLIMQW